MVSLTQPNYATLTRHHPASGRRVPWPSPGILTKTGWNLESSLTILPEHVEDAPKSGRPKVTTEAKTEEILVKVSTTAEEREKTCTAPGHK